MCCFSPISAPFTLWNRMFPPKLHVSSTSIFSRLDGDMQTLVYGMIVSVPSPVAMILPIPVARPSGDEALTFVDLSTEPRFFESLAALFDFPVPQAKGGISRGGPSRPKLVVHEVGAFVASYVPSVNDFDRVDERFHLPKDVWDALPDYSDHAFAIFQLSPGVKKAIHPMAMRFPVRDRTRLYFPTVHVHDGQVHATAHFDHALYYQHEGLGADYATSNVEPTDAISMFPPKETPLGIVDPRRVVAKRTLTGDRPNRDTYIALV